MTIAKTRTQRSVAVIVVLALLSGGCSALGLEDDEPLTADEERLREQSGRLTGTVVQGALIGTLLGGLLGGIAGGDTKSMAIGAGAGAVIGGLGGYYVGKRQQSYASEEARLDAMVADVRADNAQLRDYIVTARRVIDEDKKRIAEIDRQYASHSVDRDAAVKGLQQVKDNRSVIAETLEGLKKKKSEYQYALDETRRTNATSNLGDMDREIATLQEQIAALERDLDSLDNALAVSQVG